MTSEDVPRASVGPEGIEQVGVLGEETRRRMFAFVRRAGRPVTRDEAAASVGVSRKLAAFHLDKLVDAGLLRARFGAPGAERRVGRQPKLYEPADTQISVTIPARRPELLAELLLDGVLGETPGRSAAEAATEAARNRGRSLGERERERMRPGRLGAERGLTVCERMLEVHGYEPVRESPTRIGLHNCPFHPLAARAAELVCGLNLAFLAGYVDGLEATTVRAVLAPQPGRCCVELVGPAEPGAPSTLST